MSASELSAARIALPLMVDRARSHGDDIYADALAQVLAIIDRDLEERRTERDRSKARRTARPPVAAASLSLSLDLDQKRESREEGELERESGVQLCAPKTSGTETPRSVGERLAAGCPGEAALTTTSQKQGTSGEVQAMAGGGCIVDPCEGVDAGQPRDSSASVAPALSEPFRTIAVQSRVRDPTHCYEACCAWYRGPPPEAKWRNWCARERDKLPPAIRAAPDWVDQHGAAQDAIRQKSVPMPPEFYTRFLAKTTQPKQLEAIGE